MMDSADPLDGWDWREVLKTSSGLATNDLYGKLVVYLRRLFFDFHNVLQSHVLTFSLFNTNAGSLPHHLPKNNFARIEVSLNPTPGSITNHVDRDSRCPTLWTAHTWVSRRRSAFSDHCCSHQA